MNKNEQEKFIVSVITYEEAKEELEKNFEIVSLLDKSVKNRICKADVYPGFLFLSFSIPDKAKYGNFYHFICIITKNNVLFVDDSGRVGYYIKKMQKNKVANENNIGRFIYDFMETLVESELRYLEAFNDRIVKVENAVVGGDFERFEHKMLAIRRELLTFYRYYSQLIDIGQELQENENNFFSEEDIPYFRLFTDRVEQFHEEAKTLREYVLQLRGIYQTQFDIKQNKIMKALTVITTVTSPLTILVGWYGMNFSNMPELTWDYGYSMVILLGLVITGVSIWILKRCKLL